MKGLKEAKGGTIVLRPDSGEPVEQVSPGEPVEQVRALLRRLPWASTLGECARARGARPSPWRGKVRARPP